MKTIILATFVSVYFLAAPSLLMAGRLFIPADARGAKAPQKVTRTPKKDIPRQVTKKKSSLTAWRGKDLSVEDKAGRKYDKNKDGKLQPAETEKLLLDVYKKASRSNRKTRIKNNAVRIYDADSDGYLDSREIRSLSRVLFQ